MKKQEIREKYIEKRNQLSLEEVENWSDNIFHELSKNDIWEFENYMCYYPIPERKEVDTRTLIQELLKLQKKVFLPKVKGKEMEAVSYTSDTVLVHNQWGIPEPEKGTLISAEKIEIIFVPMVICDHVGNRIGYGKGYYDKFLSQASSDIIKIGLSFFQPLEEIIPTEPFDIPLNYCVTPTRVVSFGSKS